MPTIKIPRGTDHPFATWLLLLATFSPTIPIMIGDLTFTPGRLALLVLLAPAISILSGKDRRFAASDYFAVITACWMLFSTLANDGFKPYVGAEALDFLGAYLVGRALFFGPAPLETFLRVFKVVVVIVILLALLDTFSGRNVTLDMIATKKYLPGFRYGIVRAYSVFGGAELYGTFCVAAAAIFIFFETKWLGRIIWTSIASFGVVLSLSSGPLLGLIIVFGIFSYDFLFKGNKSRWKVLITGIALFVVTLYVVTDNPVGWMIRNLTLDPWTGYWRVAEWDHTLSELNKSPLFGYGLTPLKNVSRDFMIFVGEQGIDCVWLVEALRYGYPIVLLLGLTLLLPFFWSKAGSSTPMDNMRLGISTVVIVMSIIGLTVHFWDSDWVFFSLCLGMRASFVEFDGYRKSSNIR